MKTLRLIGMKKHIHSIAVELYFSNGEVKSVYDEDLGFQTNEKTRQPFVKIFGYKDKTEWDGEKHIITGIDEKEIKNCVVVAPKQIINEYMYKLGIFNEDVDVNRQLIENKLQSNFESTVSHLASSISFLEHSIGELNKQL